MTLGQTKSVGSGRPKAGNVCAVPWFCHDRLAHKDSKLVTTFEGEEKTSPRNQAQMPFLIHFEKLENKEMPQSIGLMMSETDVLRKSPLMKYLQHRGRN
jgi:hypothetical protein